MNKISFCVEHLASSQLAYTLIKNINEWYIKKKPNVDFVVFYDIFTRPCLMPQFCILNSAETFGMNGAMIATNCDTALRLQQTCGPQRKIFYLWDLEWLRPSNRTYTFYKQCYTSGMEIICRSESHAKLLANSFNVKANAIIENANLDQILNYCLVKECVPTQIHDIEHRLSNVRKAKNDNSTNER